MDPWICEICAEEFKNEVDLLAHQFNSSCEKEIRIRREVAECWAGKKIDKEKLRCLIWSYGDARQDLGYHNGLEGDDPLMIEVEDRLENARETLAKFLLDNGI